MAQDTGAANSAKQDIDLDEIEVDILILAKNPNNLKQTCAFLARRGWPTIVVGNLSKAIEEIAGKRPDIVMVSFNHPSPAVQRLPDLIAQTFNLICVGFVEGTDTASTTKLTNMKIRHKIFGMPSGPNFQRGIRRILAEKYNIKDDRPSDEKTNGGGNLTIRGIKAADAETMVQKSEPGATHDKGASVISGAASQRKAKIVGEKENAVNDGSNSLMESGDVASGVNSISGESAGEMKSAMQKGVGAGAKLQSTQRESEPAASSGSQAQEDSLAAEMGHVIQMGIEPVNKGESYNGKKRKKLKAFTGEERARDTAGNLLFGENLDPDKPVAEATVPEPDLVGMLKKSLFGAHPEALTPQGVLEKAVETALSQVCQRNPDIQPILLKMVNKIGVFPIESSALPGFLVIALEVGAAEDQKRFLRNCENALLGSFQSLGVQGKLESGFWLDVPEIAFSQWSENAGIFNFKLNHKGHEVGVTYFQTEKSMAKASSSAEKDMHTIDLTEISTEEPVTFKAYLYLKENKKFYLYLRNGRQLQPEQKERLGESKVSQIFLKTVDLENLRMYLAASYLKETIRNSRDVA